MGFALPAKIGRPPVDTDKRKNGHRNRSPSPNLPGVGGIGGYSAPIGANTFLAIRYFRSFPPLARDHPPSGSTSAGIERCPPKAKVTRSNRVGCANIIRHF